MATTKNDQLREIKGKPVQGFQDKLTELGDLIAEGGMPFISLLEDIDNQQYLIRWCDMNQEYNRWMLFQTNEKMMFRYFEKEINDVQLILENPAGSVYFIDINDDIVWDKTVLTSFENIPPEYLPKPHVFYKENVFEEYACQLHSRLREKFSKTEKRYPANSLETEPLMVMEPPAKPYGEKKEDQ